MRLIGGGLVRSVRAHDRHLGRRAAEPRARTRRYLEFEDGTPATLVYNGYGHFDTAELHYWVGEGGQPRDPDDELARRARAADGARPRTSGAEGGDALRAARARRDSRSCRTRASGHQPFFGLTLVSCQRGDLRQSPDGLLRLRRRRQAGDRPCRAASSGRAAELDELYQAVAQRPARVPRRPLGRGDARSLPRHLWSRRASGARCCCAPDAGPGKATRSR